MAARGDRHHHARLTELDVRYLRHNGRSVFRQIMRKTGASYAAVRFAACGLTWRHLNWFVRPVPLKPRKPCGTLAAYRRGCRCCSCKAANAAQSRLIYRKAA